MLSLLEKATRPRRWSEEETASEDRASVFFKRSGRPHGDESPEDACPVGDRNTRQCERSKGTQMNRQLKTDADRILHKGVEGSPRIPGVIAMATNPQGNIYEGAAGVRA